MYQKEEYLSVDYMLQNDVFIAPLHLIDAFVYWVSLGAHFATGIQSAHLFNGRATT